MKSVARCSAARGSITRFSLASPTKVYSSIFYKVVLFTWPTFTTGPSSKDIKAKAKAKAKAK